MVLFFFLPSNHKELTKGLHSKKKIRIKHMNGKQNNTKNKLLSETNSQCLHPSQGTGDRPAEEGQAQGSSRSSPSRRPTQPSRPKPQTLNPTH